MKIDDEYKICIIGNQSGFTLKGLTEAVGVVVVDVSKGVVLDKEFNSIDVDLMQLQPKDLKHTSKHVPFYKRINSRSKKW